MTKSALLLVDMQNDYFPAFPNCKMPLPAMQSAASNAVKLLIAARSAGTPVIHVRHVMASDAAPFFHPGTEGADIHPSVAPLPTERVVEKTRPNSFVETGLEDELRAGQIGHLTICGAMSQMCVDATVRAAVDLGFKVTVPEDACAAATITFNDVRVPAEMVHASIMAPLAASYAEVKKTRDCVQATSR